MHTCLFINTYEVECLWWWITCQVTLMNQIKNKTCNPSSMCICSSVHPRSDKTLHLCTTSITNRWVLVPTWLFFNVHILSASCLMTSKCNSTINTRGRTVCERGHVAHVLPIWWQPEAAQHPPGSNLLLKFYNLHISLFLSLKFVYIVFLLIYCTRIRIQEVSSFFSPVKGFFLIWIEGLWTEGAVCCTVCKTPWGKLRFVILDDINKTFRTADANAQVFPGASYCAQSSSWSGSV